MIVRQKVVVCGAGPAGSSTSLFLSKLEIPHVLIDKSDFPREKVCGDGITPVCFSILEQVIPQIKNDFAQHKAMQRIEGCRLYSNNGRYIDILAQEFVPKEKNHVYTASRKVFDDYLLEKAKQQSYCQFYDNMLVKEIINHDDYLEINAVQHNQSIKIQTALYIAADGDRSLARKIVYGTAINRKETVAAIRTYYRGVKPAAGNRFYEIFALKSVLPGYLWIFPMADNTWNVGLGITSDKVQKDRINLKNVLQELVKNHPAIKDRFEGAEAVRTIEGSGLPLMLHTQPKLSTNRILLTGDAASLADPISGEGIGPAIISGKYAALAAQEAIAQDNYSASNLEHLYDQILHTKLTSKYELKIKMAWLADKPQYINYLVYLASKTKWFMNFFINSSLNKYQYKDLFNPFKWKQIFSTPQ